ncbi:MAG: class I SAM-dependent methyltransferase [Synoicihabitans sp.]
MDRADSRGFIRFDQFMDVALYHPEEGYYRRQRERVGRSASSDFYTASSLGPVFGELVTACCLNKLGDHAPGEFEFIEIGAEKGHTVLDGIEHPFAKVRAIGPGQKIAVSGKSIVFSNELFDAQPCRRFRGTEAGWVELGVNVEDHNLVAAETVPQTPPAELPQNHLAGYHLDLPFAARDLATALAAQSWQGLFIAFDYGKSWRELSEETPQGTVRAYHHHRQSNALLEHVGEQDLTCHVCWDWLAESLQKEGFSVDPVASQEAFLVKNAATALAQIMAEEAQGISERKSGLLQLLHPSALGQKFQVLSAWREDL